MHWETGKRYRILYESESGETTERSIDLIRTSRSVDGRIFLRAYCHLREEERTFRADQILRAELVSAVPSLPPALRLSAPPRVVSATETREPPRKERKSFGEVLGMLVGYGFGLVLMPCSTAWTSGAAIRRATPPGRRRLRGLRPLHRGAPALLGLGSLPGLARPRAWRHGPCGLPLL
jgi:hypothetical protein